MFILFRITVIIILLKITLLTKNSYNYYYYYYIYKYCLCYFKEFSDIFFFFSLSKPPFIYWYLNNDKQYYAYYHRFLPILINKLSMLSLVYLKLKSLEIPFNQEAFILTNMFIVIQFARY